MVTDTNGLVKGHISFARESEQVEEVLVNVPHASGSHSAGTKTIGMMVGPPLGGQCVRRHTQ